MALLDQIELPKPLKFTLNWGRKYSLWTLQFGLACCAIEMAASMMPRHDIMRFGVIPFPASPRQADVMIVPATRLTKITPPPTPSHTHTPRPTTPTTPSPRPYPRPPP